MACLRGFEQANGTVHDPWWGQAGDSLDTILVMMQGNQAFEESGKDDGV